jgi:hypothetical protein
VGSLQRSYAAPGDASAAHRDHLPPGGRIGASPDHSHECFLVVLRQHSAGSAAGGDDDPPRNQVTDAQ